MTKSFIKLASLIFLVFTVSSPAQENYSQWAYQKAIAINTSSSGANVAANATNFPLLVRLTSANADVFTGALAGGADIRFAKPDGAHLKYQIERWDAPGQGAEMWVFMDTVFGNNASQSIKMYWGKAGALDSSKGAAVFDTAKSFVSVWHMDNTLANATANVFTVVNSGTVDSTGMIGRGRSFSGTSQHIRVANHDALNVTAAITLSAWFNATDWGTATSVNRRILQKSNDNLGYSLQEITAVDNLGAYYYGTTPTTTAIPSVQAPDPTANVWHHVHSTYNGVAANLYIDGALVASQACSGSIATSTAAGDSLEIGRKPASSSTTTSLFSGRMDEVRIQKTARDSNWIKLDYETQKAGGTAVVVGATVTLPGAVTGVTAAAGNAQATISWTAPGSNGGSAITAYTATSVADTSKHCNSTGSLTCVVTGLTNGTAYSFTVTATNTAGTGPGSAPSNSVTPFAPPGVGGMPTVVVAVAGNSQVTVSWQAPSSDGGSPILGYRATSNPDGKTCSTTGALTCVVTGLTNGTAYTFSVVDSNSAGSSAASAPSAAVTPVGPPGTPTAVWGASGNAQVVVSWSAPASNGGAAVTGYKAMAVADTTKFCTTTGLTCVITGLTNGVSYTFVVKASNSAGSSAASAPSPSVPSQTVPGFPTITSVTGASGQVTVVWSAPASNGGSAITGYTVTSLQDTTKKCTSTALSCVVTGLTNTTSYTFTVVAVNAVGKSVASPPSAAVTAVIGGAGENGFAVRKFGSSLAFHLPEGFSRSQISVLDVWGRTVWTRTVAAGVRSQSWDGTTAGGRQAAGGVYLVRVKSSARVLEKKIAYAP